MTPTEDRAGRSCYEKRRYGDEKQALRVAAECTEKRGTPLRVYACFECGGYHLSKTKAFR